MGPLARGGQPSTQMSERAPAEDFARVRKERDLFLSLLNLGDRDDLDSFLREALALIVDVTEAQQGYLELYDEFGAPPRWWIAHGFDERQVAEVRSKISSSIVAKALATGETIVTPSAMLDPEFNDQDSVRINKIQAVLCAPVGDAPSIGVLYLQGRVRPGLFDRHERELARLFARHLAPLAHRLITTEQSKQASDPTAEIRRRLDVARVIGTSQALANLLKQVSLAAPVNVGVLLTGECGTGKSQLAEVIHDNSPRATKPFVELNCAAIPENLLEAELFGALEGSFTGATRRLLGKVEAAEGGTLFLDEVAEIPLAAQAKLLHLLQKKTFYPLGAEEPSTADVRLIAASNVDLEEAVRQKKFREDLYFRLDVMKIRVPSLQERREDIRCLLRHFCNEACERHQLPALEVSPGALLAAETAAWPGHVRQLAHASEVAAIRAAGEGSPAIEAAHLFPEQAGSGSTTMTFQQATRAIQAGLLRDVLEQNDWNVIKTAEQLDLARSHVYNLMRTLNVKK